AINGLQRRQDFNLCMQNRFPQSGKKNAPVSGAFLLGTPANKDRLTLTLLTPRQNSYGLFISIFDDCQKHWHPLKDSKSYVSHARRGGRNQDGALHGERVIRRI